MHVNDFGRFIREGLGSILVRGTANRGTARPYSHVQSFGVALIVIIAH
jgi:hypothetical protein